MTIKTDFYLIISLTRQVPTGFAPRGPTRRVMEKTHRKRRYATRRFFLFRLLFNSIGWEPEGLLWLYGRTNYWSFLCPTPCDSTGGYALASRQKRLAARVGLS